MDDAELQIVIDGKNIAEPAFREAKDQINDMRAAVDRLRADQAAGIPVAAAVAAITGMQTDAYKDATDAVKDHTAALRGNMLQTGWNTTFGEALTAQELAYAKLQMATSAGGGGGGGAGAWGAITALPGVWAQVAIGIGLAAAALWPFTMLLGSAVVLMTSFAVGAAGFAAIAALVAGVFGAIGAGVLVLGGGGGVGAANALTAATEKLQSAKETLVEFDAAHPFPTVIQAQTREQDVENIAKAQLAYNDALARAQGPVGVLLGQLSTMKDTLSQQAAPLAALITQWVGGAVPGVTQLGQTIMSWFGDRLPGVLAGMSRVIKDLTPDFIAFGQYFGGIMDKVGPMLAPMAEAFARLAIQGARGLLDNLLRLSEWFVKELPTLGPKVADIFGQIGRFIQWVASEWATLNDFAINKWPTTVKNVQKDLSDLRDWWDKNGPSIKTFGQNMVDLMGQMSNVIGIFTTLYNFLNGINFSPGVVLGGINKIADALKFAGDQAERLNRALSVNLGGPGTPLGNTGRAGYTAAQRQRGFT